MTDNAKQEREGVDFDMDAATAAYLLGVTHGRDDESAKIADWFLRHNQRQLADEIKAKEYLK